VVCTLLYLSVAVVLTGIVPWQSLIDDAAPVVNSLKKLSCAHGSSTLNWVGSRSCLGAMMGMISSLLVFQLGRRACGLRCRAEWLDAKWFGKVHPRFRTPRRRPGSPVCRRRPGGVLDIGTLADLSNIDALRVRSGLCRRKIRRVRRSAAGASVAPQDH